VPPTPTSKEETVALPTLPHPQVLVTLGVDTHADSHVAAALDQAGRPLGTRTTSTTPGGYAALLGWATGFGTVDRIGVEGTGSYGAGLARWLRAHGQLVIEVDRPDRTARRRQGKADDLDAYAAARAVQAGTATGQPKAGDGTVEMIRSLRLARRSAVKARTQAANQLKALLVTAPDALRAQLRHLPPAELVTTAARLRAATKPATPSDAAKLALRSIARRWLQLTQEVTALDTQLERLVAMAAPALVAVKGVGTETAAVLLVAAGDNPERLRSEAAFAHLCGVAPILASSGKITRHRLDRGGNREANWALYLVAVGGWPGTGRPTPTQKCLEVAAGGHLQAGATLAQEGVGLAHRDQIGSDRPGRAVLGVEVPLEGADERFRAERVHEQEG
jgi:transposase